MAVAGLDVGQSVVLVRRRAQGLGEDLEALDAQRDLAVAAADGAAVDADQITQIERGQPGEELGAEDVDAGMELELAGPVDEVQEGRLAGPTAGGDAPGDAVVLVGFLARLEVLVGGQDRGRRLGTGEGVWEGRLVLGPQPPGLGAALGDQLGQPVPRTLAA